MTVLWTGMSWGVHTCRTESFTCGIWCYLQEESVKTELNTGHPAGVCRITYCGDHPSHTGNWVQKHKKKQKLSACLREMLGKRGSCFLGSHISAIPFFLRALSMIGLALIALGTGGIKPCVSAFGGDQFEEGQVRACTLTQATSVNYKHSGIKFHCHKFCSPLILFTYTWK